MYSLKLNKCKQWRHQISRNGFKLNKELKHFEIKNFFFSIPKKNLNLEKPPPVE